MELRDGAEDSEEDCTLVEIIEELIKVDIEGEKEGCNSDDDEGPMTRALILRSLMFKFIIQHPSSLVE